MANLEARRADFARFQKLGVQILGVSMSHHFSQKAFAASMKLPYPLLSDYPNGKNILKWGVEQYEGKERRLYARQGFFLIDKKGIVRGKWVTRQRRPDEVRAPDLLFESNPILELAEKIAREG